MKPRVSQLAQSGATNGQVITWNNTAGQWEPDDPTGGDAILFCGARAVAAGGETLLTLGSTPIANSEIVAVNGAVKDWTTAYTRSGAVITFASPLATSDVVLVRYATTDNSCGSPSLDLPPLPLHQVIPRPAPRRFHRPGRR